MENYKDLSSHVWRQELQFLRVLRQPQLLGWELQDLKIKSKNVTSRKLRAFEQSHLDARFAAYSSWERLRSTKLQGWEFQIFWLKKNFWKNIKKSKNTSSLENYKNMSSHIWRQDLQPLRVLRQPPLQNWAIQILKKKKLAIETFEKFTKKRHSSKKEFEQSYLEAKFAIPGSTLTKPHYRDGNLKFCEIYYI